MGALLAKDDELIKACEELEGHLIFERKCAELRRQISAEDKAAKELMHALKQAEEQITRAVEKAESVVSHCMHIREIALFHTARVGAHLVTYAANIEQAEAFTAAEAAPLDLEDLLYLARNISNTVRSRPQFGSPGCERCVDLAQHTPSINTKCSHYAHSLFFSLTVLVFCRCCWMECTRMKGFLNPKPLAAEMSSGWLMHECLFAAAPPPAERAVVATVPPHAAAAAAEPAAAAAATDEDDARKHLAAAPGLFPYNP